MSKRKVQPPPIIDLGGKIKVIDDTQSPPRWKTIADCFPACQAQARKIICKHGLLGAWLFDDCGYKVYVVAQEVMK